MRSSKERSVNSTIVEGAELRGPSAQRPDERERRGNSVEEESEPPHELQCLLGLTLDLIEWMAQRKKNGAEAAAGECGKCRVAVLFRHLEGATRRIDPLPERSRPRDHDREAEIGPCPKVSQSATLEQIAGHPCRVDSLHRSGRSARWRSSPLPRSSRCGVAVAVLQAEIGGPADAERVQDFRRCTRPVQSDW